MSNDQLAIFRGEVLRQLIGSSAGWLFITLFIFALYRYLWFVQDCIKDGKLYVHFSRFFALFKGVGEVKDGDLGSFAVLRGRDVLRKAVIYLAIFLLGYHLSYHINATYISGDISLIVTVSRVMHYYQLTLLVIESLLLFIYLVSLWFMSSAVSKGRPLKVFGLTRMLLTSFGLMSAVVIPLGGILTVYSNLVG